MKTCWKILITILILFCVNGCGGVSGKNESSSINQKLTMNFLAVGQGDSIYIKMPDGRDILIDGGQGDDVLEQLPIVMDQGDRKINLLILTHPHIDHLFGLLKVIKNYEVDEIWETGVNYISPDYTYWKTEIKKLGIINKKVFVGTSMQFGMAEIQVLAPEKSYNNIIMFEPNRCSIVCQVNYRSFKALLLSDADIEEQSIFTSSLENQTVLKVAHHGASDAAYEQLWQMTRPNISILTVSDFSQYLNLPSQQVVDLISSYAKSSYRTNKHGIITIITDGLTYQVKTQK